jgi:hypothetical protein
MAAAADVGSRAAWVASVALAVIVVIVWVGVLPGVFQFDDYAVIVDNPRVQTWHAWLKSMPGIRPLLKASYTLSWTLGGGAVAPFVALNILLHATNAVLVSVLARRWLQALTPALPGLHLACALAAFAFALHPAQTEAVTYVSGRSVSMMAAFYLAGLLAWDAEKPRRRAAACALFVAAMATKETAVTWPFALLLLAGVRSGDWRLAWHETRGAFAVLGIAVLAMLTIPTYRRLFAASLATRDPLANLAAQVDGIGYLIATPLLRLSTNIDPDVLLTAFGAMWWLQALLLAALVAAAVVALAPAGAAMPDAARKAVLRAPVAGLALGWFLLHLTPTNSLVARFDLANDRELYLALIGPAIGTAVLLARRLPRRALLPAVAMIVFALGAATLDRNRDYASEVALWEATARTSPAKARVFNNLGYAREQAGDRGGARSAYLRSLELDPEFYKAQINLYELEREWRPAD